MAAFPGGSAWAMAKDIAGGYLLVTERTYQRFELGQLDLFAFELDRALRDTRGEQVALEDLEAIKTKNRRLTRLTGALSMLKSYQQRKFKKDSRPLFDGKS